MNRRQFIDGVLFALAAGTVLGPAMLAGCSGSGSSSTSGGGGSGGGTSGAAAPVSLSARPNILLVLMDEFRIPPAGYGPAEGELAPIKEILGFSSTVSPNNPFTKFFTGFTRLRKNAVVLRKHYIASAACVPSRTAIMTGQYSSLTKATSTDGIFKSGEEMQAAGLFLNPSGVPTIGDWFKAAGYDSKYFGKWHVSNEGSGEAPWDLTPWGFDCWTESGPEPHGAAVSNTGTFRDPGFALNAVDFLSGKGPCVPTPGKPWLAVSSFVNPHDIATYPFPYYLPGGQGVMPPQVPLNQPQPIPASGTVVANPNATAPENPTSSFPPTVALNPDGFPQLSFGAPPTLNEDLSTKPSCHFDYSYKLGMALKSKFTGSGIQALMPFPFQDQGNQSVPWMIAYGQFYTYLHYLSDMQMRTVLQALDDNGLAGNTIVVFTADHGEYSGAHNFMLEKWHTMYEEALHVPFVVSSPLVNPSADGMREVTQATSHIDLAPTLLGLAGFTPQEVAGIQTTIQGHTPTAFVGTDLSPYIRGEKSVEPITGPDGLPRFGPLFVGDDEITAPLAGQAATANFADFLALVEQQRQKGVPLTPGPVRQPNHVRAITDGTWKLARYLDPNGVVPDQWEMYNLAADPNETTNLLVFTTRAVRTDVTVGALTTAVITAQRDLMLAALSREESRMLKTSV